MHPHTPLGSVWPCCSAAAWRPVTTPGAPHTQPLSLPPQPSGTAALAKKMALGREAPHLLAFSWYIPLDSGNLEPGSLSFCLCTCSCRTSEKELCVGITTRKVFLKVLYSAHHMHTCSFCLHGSPTGWEPLFCALLISVSLAKLFPMYALTCLCCSESIVDALSRCDWRTLERECIVVLTKTTACLFSFLFSYLKQ